MSSDLYEILGLEKTATSEDIRKAYRKKALKTHPDRLPQGVSQTERQHANEQFRLVNNAYEVLTDDNNRKLYDQYGVWPPPAVVEPESRASPSTTFRFGGTNRSPFNNDPFFPSGSFNRSFGFSDPFELFRSLFGDIHNIRDDFGDADPFFGMHRNPFMASPFGTPFGSRDPFSSGFPLGGPSILPGFGSGMARENVRSYSSVSQTIGQGGQWVSQSTMTRMINGRTERITKKRDAQGNEHITYSSPEGERYTINGVEQASRSLPSSSDVPPALPYASLPQVTRSYATNMDTNATQQPPAVISQYQQHSPVPSRPSYGQPHSAHSSSSHHSHQHYHNIHTKQPYEDPSGDRHNHSSRHSGNTQHDIFPPSVNYSRRPHSPSGSSRESGQSHSGRSRTVEPSGNTNYDINADGSTRSGASRGWWQGPQGW